MRDSSKASRSEGAPILKEIVLIPTYQRNHFLSCALRRIREQDSKIKVMVFSDRGEDNEELRSVVKQFGAHLRIAPVHDFYGNSFNVLEAMKWAVECRYDLIHINEDDTFQHTDCLDWHRGIHDLIGDIFCSCGWVFNLHAPITKDLMMAPWFYAPNSTWKRDKLALVVKHANPRYYCAMQDYVLKTFPNSILHDRGRQRTTKFFEQDAVVQYVMEQDKTQAAWRASAVVDHMGNFSYNRPDGVEFVGTLEERIAQVEKLAADPYLRAEIFSRPIVERELGHALPKRFNKYRVTLPGGWTSDYYSELAIDQLPKRINSVHLGKDSLIESVS